MYGGAGALFSTGELTAAAFMLAIGIVIAMTRTYWS